MSHSLSLAVLNLLSLLRFTEPNIRKTTHESRVLYKNESGCTAEENYPCASCSHNAYQWSWKWQARPVKRTKMDLRWECLQFISWKPYTGRQVLNWPTCTKTRTTEITFPWLKIYYFRYPFFFQCDLKYVRYCAEWLVIKFQKIKTLCCLLVGGSGERRCDRDVPSQKNTPNAKLLCLKASSCLHWS